jgi:hypothetical protein
VSASERFVLVLSLALAGCGSDPPGSVDHEQPAVDLEACAAGAADCVREGTVTSVESLLPGDGHAVHLVSGASIRAPLMRPSATTKLAYLAIAVRAVDADSTTMPIKTAQIAVHIDGAIDATARPTAGFTRFEIESKRVVPGATVTIRCTAGEVDLVYVEGRWDD